MTNVFSIILIVNLHILPFSVYHFLETYLVHKQKPPINKSIKCKSWQPWWHSGQTVPQANAPTTTARFYNCQLSLARIQTQKLCFCNNLLRQYYFIPTDVLPASTPTQNHNKINPAYEIWYLTAHAFIIRKFLF